MRSQDHTHKETAYKEMNIIELLEEKGEEEED